MFKIRLAHNIVSSMHASFIHLKLHKSLIFNGLAYNVRNIKPIVPKLVTDNLPKQTQLDYDWVNFLEEQEKRLGTYLQYEPIMPGVFRTYPMSEQESKEQFDFELRSKRHRHAKLKRAKRRDDKVAQIQNINFNQTSVNKYKQNYDAILLHKKKIEEQLN